MQALGPIPDESMDAYLWTVEIYSSTRMLLAVLPPDRLAAVRTLPYAHATFTCEKKSCGEGQTRFVGGILVVEEGWGFGGLGIEQDLLGRLPVGSLPPN